MKIQLFYVLSILVLLTASCSSNKAYQSSGVPNDPSLVRPIQVGQKIPNSDLYTIEGKPIQTQEVLASKPTLLIFYRGSWCPYCNVHLEELRKIENDLKDKGFQIVAISPDQPKYLKKSIEKNSLSYTLLSDADMSLTKSVGLAYEVDKTMRVMLRGFGISLEKQADREHHLLPVPAALLVDTSSEVTFIFYSYDYKKRVSSDLILSAAESQVNQ